MKSMPWPTVLSRTTSTLFSGSLNNTNNQGATDLGASMFSGSSRMMTGGNRGTGSAGMLGGNFNVGNESKDASYRW